jgi:hypothetical protein
MHGHHPHCPESLLHQLIPRLAVGGVLLLRRNYEALVEFFAAERNFLS